MHSDGYSLWSGSLNIVSVPRIGKFLLEVFAYIVALRCDNLPSEEFESQHYSPYLDFLRTLVTPSHSIMPHELPVVPSKMHFGSH